MEESAMMLTVPRSAITLVNGSRGVFVKREQHFAFVPVTLGREGEGWFKVLDGLNVGDTVVAQGVFDLKNALLKESIQGE